MQSKNLGIFAIIENYIDIALNLLAFLIGYVFTLLLPESVVSTPSEIFITNPIAVVLLFSNALVCSLVYHAFNLYGADKYARVSKRISPIIRANFVFYGVIAVIAAFVTRTGYKDFILFWILFSFLSSSAIISAKRQLINIILSSFRQRQYHLRKVIIVGDNSATAAAYLKEISSDSNSGVMVMGFVGDKMDASVLGVEKLGAFRELAQILDKKRPTDVVFAIDAYDKRHLIKLVNLCEEKCIKVYFLPVIYGFFKSSRQIEQVGSIPLVNIHSTPLDNLANRIVKRIVDVVGSAILILLTLPVMIFVAIGVKITSPGPIFFCQRRVGKMGKYFTMYKFRSMRVNKEGNKAWSTPTDSRKTKFGTFLRQTAIDELPQLFNVLMGQMSLVGPRPEIPKFVNEFKETIPLYMIKHYVKPGMTGLAQIKGLRGDTSIEERIHEDINYIENWTLWLDIYILLKTPFKAFNKSEQYVSPEEIAMLDETLSGGEVADGNGENTPVENAVVEGANVPEGGEVVKASEESLEFILSDTPPVFVEPGVNSDAIKDVDIIVLDNGADDGEKKNDGKKEDGGNE